MNTSVTKLIFIFFLLFSLKHDFFAKDLPVGFDNLNIDDSEVLRPTDVKFEKLLKLIEKLERNGEHPKATQLKKLTTLNDNDWFTVVLTIVHLDLLDKLVERQSIDDSLLQKLFKQLQFAQEYDLIKKKAHLIQKELNEERSRIEDWIYRTVLEEPTNSDDLKTCLQNLSTNLTESSKFKDQQTVIAQAAVKEPTDFNHLEELFLNFELMYRDRFDSITLKNTVSNLESNASSPKSISLDDITKSIEEVLSEIDLETSDPTPESNASPLIQSKSVDYTNKSLEELSSEIDELLSEDPMQRQRDLIRINFNHELATVLIQAEFYLQSGNFEEAIDLLSLSYEYFKQDGRRTLWIDELLRYRIDENSTEGLDHLRPTSLKQKGKVGIPQFHNNVQTFVLPILFPSDLELFDKKKIILQGLDPLDPTRIIHLLELGRIAKKRGNLGEAEKILKEAYSLSLYHSYIGNGFKVSLSFEPGFNIVREIIDSNLTRFHLNQFPQKGWPKNSNNSFQVDKHLKKIFRQAGINPSEIVIIPQKRNKEKISFTIQSAQSFLAEQKLKSWFSQVREKGISVCGKFDCDSSSCATDPFIAYVRRNMVNNLTFSSIEYLETLIQMRKTNAARNFLNSCSNYDETFYSVCERLWKNDSKELCTNFVNKFFPEETLDESSLSQARDAFQKFAYNAAFGTLEYIPRNPNELIGYFYAMDKDYSKSLEQVSISIDSRRKKLGQEWEYEDAYTIVAHWITHQDFDKRLEFIKKGDELRRLVQFNDPFFNILESIDAGRRIIGKSYFREGYQHYKELLAFVKSQENEKNSKSPELQMLIIERLGGLFYKSKDLSLNEKLEQTKNYYLDGIEVFERSNESLNVMNICILAQLHLNLVRTYKEMKNDQGAIDSIEKLLFILSHLPLSFEDCKKFNRQLRDFFISTNHSEKEKDLSRYQSEFDRRLKDYEESLRNFFLEKLYEFNSISSGREYEIDEAFKYFEENFKGEFESYFNFWDRNRNRLYHFFALLRKFEQKLDIPSSNEVKILSLLRGMTLSPKKDFNLYASSEHIKDLVFSGISQSFSNSFIDSLPFVNLYFELGKCYKKLNRYDKAIHYYERGISDCLEFEKIDISKIGPPTKETVDAGSIEEMIQRIDNSLFDSSVENQNQQQQQSTDLPVQLFKPMRECALLYALTGDMDKALEYYRLIGEPEKELYASVGLHFIEKKDHTKAFQTWIKAGKPIPQENLSTQISNEGTIIWNSPRRMKPATERLYLELLNFPFKHEDLALLKEFWEDAEKPAILTEKIITLCEDVEKFNEAEQYRKMLPEQTSGLGSEVESYFQKLSSRKSLLKQKKYPEALESYRALEVNMLLSYSSDTNYYFLILQDLHPEYRQTDYEILEKEILEVIGLENNDIPSSQTFEQIATSYFAFSKEENLDQNESLFYQKRAIEVQKKLIKSKPNEDIELIEDYFTLGKYQLAFGDIKEALESFEKSVRLTDAPGVPPKFKYETPEKVGFLLFEDGIYLEAIKFYKSALKQEKKENKDAKNTDLSILYNHIGLPFYYLNNGKGAEENFLKGLELIHDQNETEDKILRATLQLNMGYTLFSITNDFVSAIEYFEKAIHIYENLIKKKSFFEEEYLNYGDCVLSNTMCHLELGNYTKAEQNFVKWLKWNVSRSENKLEDIWGNIWENNLQFAHIIEMEPQFLKKFADFADDQNLKPKISAEIFRSLGDYYDEISLPKNACHYFKKALTKLQQVQDNDRQAEAEINFRIGNLLEESEATEYLEQALSIYQDLEGNESYNVAECYASIGRYEKALDIYTKIHGPMHSDIGYIYLKMAIEEFFKENLPKGLEYAKKSLKTILTSKNKNLPAIPEAYFLLGRFHVEMKEYKNALEYLKKAAEMVKILDEGFDYNSKRFEFINYWMLVCASELKDDKLAEELANNQLGIREKYLLEYFPQLGQSDKMERMRWDMLGHCFRHVSPSKFAQYILRTKGLVLDSIIEDETGMKSSENPKVRELFQQKDSLERHLRIVQSDPNLLAREKEVRSQLGHVSERLAEENYNKQYKALSITLGQVQKKLPANSVLVEFIEYPTFNADDGFLWDEEKYGAVILFPNSKSDSNDSNIQPVRIFYENEKDIRKHLTELLIWSGDSDSTFPKHALPELYRLVAKPIIDQLPENIDSLILSPDGILTFLPFSALYENPGSPFLAEQFNLFQVSSGRDLLDDFQTFHSKTITLFGNPEYKKAVPFPQREENWLAMQMEDNEHFRNLSLAPLPGTAEEVAMLQNLVNGSYLTTSYLGPEATEENLRKVQNPGILHLATHGFFIESQDKIKSNSGQSRFFGLGSSQESELSNPMRRAGLALAGAQNTFDAWAENKSTISENDGIFTGEEAAVLNLNNTWLTTLSACETGKGSTMPGEGVFGLRRAFSLAGTQNLLLTLWPASDKHSVPFMKSFYEAALKDGDAAKALVKVQRDLLVKYREQFSLSQAVRYIAPFVLTFRGPCPKMEAPPISASMASIKLSNELKEDFLSKYAMLIGLAVALSLLTMGFFFHSRRSKG